MADLRDWFEKTALDPDFRELFQSDPEASFAGFDLTAEERRILAAQDGALVGLLARALAPMESAPVGAPLVVDPAPPPPPLLPDATVYLQVQPQVVDGAVQHAVSLHADPAAIEGGGVFAIRVSALASTGEGGATQVHYDAALDPLMPEVDPRGPWGHKTDSAAAREAAEAVLQAAPEERRARLVALVQALVS